MKRLENYPLLYDNGFRPFRYFDSFGFCRHAVLLLQNFFISKLVAPSLSQMAKGRGLLGVLNFGDRQGALHLALSPKPIEFPFH